ncbi:virulence-associated E family protein [Parabacteroides distasonis]|nr:virulence-associated E family protein [Parabacteroides distasonis]
MVHVKDPAKQSLWASCFKKWFVAMVASWMADEVTNHEILVLIGRQGIYKTTWIDRLMP